MAKHTQTIRRQIANELLECVWPFCGIAVQRVNHFETVIAYWLMKCLFLIDGDTLNYFFCFLSLKSAIVENSRHFIN